MTSTSMLTAGLVAAVLFPTTAQAAPQPTPPPSLAQIYAGGGLGVVSSQRLAGRHTTQTIGRSALAGGHVRPDAKVRVASVTKVMVATTILQLVERGSIRLDAPIETYLPGKLRYGSKITVRQLLNHTSGLPAGALESQAPVPAGGTQREKLSAYLKSSWTTEQLLRMANRITPATAPGKTYAYSNVNFTLATLVVQAVTRKPFGQVLQQQILTPLHLLDTSWTTSRSTMTAPYLRGYMSPLTVGEPASAAKVEVTQQAANVLYGSGNVVSTAPDLNTFFQGLLAGRLIKPATLKQMLTPSAASGNLYGLGIVVLASPCGTIVGHGGNLLGYDTSAFTLGTRTIVNTATTDGSWPRTVQTSPTKVELSPQYRAHVARIEANVLGRLCPALLDPSPSRQSAPFTPLITAPDLTP